MSVIALEMPYGVAVDFHRRGLLGTGGQMPGREHVFECLLSDLEWAVVKAELEVHNLQFKVQLQNDVKHQSFNNPSW